LIGSDSTAGFERTLEDARRIVPLPNSAESRKITYCIRSLPSTFLVDLKTPVVPVTALAGIMLRKRMAESVAAAKKIDSATVTFF
jgi:hypothetical protein